MDEPGDHDIRVSVEPAFLESESDASQDRYVFAYTVQIHNAGAVPAQLLTRHWLITDTNGRVQEVRGDGVIGQQPRLAPGETYRYRSFAMLETAVGTMEGSYQMEADDGTRFEAPIERFTLSVPRVIH
ncbi:MAG: Co2+/Mg2+ efflux protein ApaG [Pseudomonadota bacterium]|nr:Co2+/Mg2+ efflux protein ApaG [Pseudomonadota bacterium]